MITIFTESRVLALAYDGDLDDEHDNGRADYSYIYFLHLQNQGSEPWPAEALSPLHGPHGPRGQGGPQWNW